MKQEQNQRQASKAQFSVEIAYYHLTINVDSDENDSVVLLSLLYIYRK